MQYRHTPAVILADYDCIEYHLAERKTSTLANRNEKWIRTKHFHRTRYYINSQQAANSLSYVPYSLRTDITDFTYHKITVMGIRIIKPDGRINTINTQPYFKPKIRSRRNPTNDTDTIHVELLEPGDILDVFIYHNFQEPISPYQLAAPIGYPLLNYEGRAIVDVQLWLKYAGTFPKEQTTLEEQNGQYVLLCKLCDDSGSAKGLPQIMDISVEILK